jgi:hypothetical protein
MGGNDEVLESQISAACDSSQEAGGFTKVSLAELLVRPHTAILKPSHLSGFYGSLECLKNISDIQYQTG